MKTVLAAAALAAAVAAPALATAQTPPRQCFAMSQLRGTTIVDDSTINARVGSDVWQVKMRGRCTGLRMSRGGFILNLHSGASLICGPIDLDISVNDSVTPGACLVDTLRKLSPAEATALPKKEQP